MGIHSHIKPLLAVTAVWVLFQSFGPLCMGDPAPIVGAFGLHLGDVYQPSASDTSYSDVPAFTGYNILSPPNPLALFGNYSVTVGAKTHEICVIEASDVPKSNRAEDTAFQNFMQFLKARYGPPSTFSGGSLPRAEFRMGFRQINFFVEACPTLDRSRLTIRYSDRALLKKIADQAAAKVAVPNKGI